MSDKPERADVLYAIAVLSTHSTQLEGGAETAYEEGAAQLRKRAAQTDKVVGWLNAMSLREESALQHDNDTRELEHVQRVLDEVRRHAAASRDAALLAILDKVVGL